MAANIQHEVDDISDSDISISNQIDPNFPALMFGFALGAGEVEPKAKAQPKGKARAAKATPKPKTEPKPKASKGSMKRPAASHGPSGVLS